MSLGGTVIRNNAGAGVEGDAIAHALVANSAIVGNRRGGVLVSGSALRDAISVSVGGSTIDGNDGPGLSAGLPIGVDLFGSTISRNSGPGIVVGGHCLGGSSLTVGQSTITQNGAGIVATGLSGASSVSQSTVADNATGGVQLGFCPWAAASIASSILTSVDGPACGATPCDGCGPAEPVTVATSLVSATAGGCAMAPDVLIGVDPRLGALADNGASTATRALLAGSPAIDAAGACSGTDQRGVARPQLAACDMGAFESACGNGAVDPGEQCDDGTPGDGDCCSADCRLEPAGSSCAGDGELCTADVCDGGGACTHSFPPVAGCHAALPRGASLVVHDADTDRADRISWKWRGPSSLADFVDAMREATLGLCVADAGGNLLLSAAMPAGGTYAGKPRWRATTSGFGYSDPERSAGGVRTAMVRASSAGLATIRMMARGEALGVGGLPLPLPATVRLVRSDAPVCWESVLTTARRNDAEGFRGKVD